MTVDGDGSRLPPREQVVLAALVVRRGEVVAAETLADAWWGEQVPATWTKALQGCLVQLRKALGAAAIETRPHGYCLVLPADEPLRETITMSAAPNASMALESARQSRWQSLVATARDEKDPAAQRTRTREAVRAITVQRQEEIQKPGYFVTNRRPH